ncbi:MAG TPA: hypothetical protein ENJ93_04550 [Chloroflexi bacterium]|nr:hypothetical protein [Chloroflexota bacterium]
MKNEIEVMRVFRVPPRGQLAVEINGQRYENISDIEAANWRQLALTAVGELIHFAGGYQTLVDAGVAAPAASPAPPSPAGESPPLSPEEQQAQFLAEQQAQLLAAKASRTVRQPGIIPPLGKTKKAPAEQQPLSLLEQIDLVLQKHVLADPELANRSIHLTGSGEGGVHVNVDGKIYDNPRDIEDSRIKLAIKMALKEWESM